jgi:hypothetical protein
MEDGFKGWLPGEEIVDPDGPPPPGVKYFTLDRSGPFVLPDARPVARWRSWLVWKVFAPVIRLLDPDRMVE